MKQKLLLISGKKQAGKSSLKNYITGVKLVDNNVLSTFNISTKGELMVPVQRGIKTQLECLDLNTREIEFIKYASVKIWPFAKSYSFANYLKYTAIDLFNLEYDQCFGSDEDKNTETNIRWSDIAFALPPRRVGAIKNKGKFDDFLTAREFLEEFGTTICRKIYYNCWAEKCKKEILYEGYPFCMIDDVRFPNEIELFKNDENFECLSIRLNRNIFKSDSEAEIALDEYLDFDFVVNNSELEIKDKNEQVLNFLREKEWL